MHRKYYDEKINFFVNTAHNIRTPLSLVLAPLADLAKDATLGDKSRKFLEMAQRNGDKLLKMVTELLDFQKIAVAKTQVRLQKVELSVLLRQQVDKFQMSAQEKHISLRLATCGQHIFSTDLSMMDLIFENLLSNAVKYTQVGGEFLPCLQCGQFSGDGQWLGLDAHSPTCAETGRKVNIRERGRQGNCFLGCIA